MGNQAFEALKAAVKSDKALLDKLSDHTEMGDAAEALAGIAKARGIDISAEQIKAQMVAGPGGKPDDELDDAALENVAGGGSPYCMSTDGCYCMCTGKFTESWF